MKKIIICLVTLFLLSFSATAFAGGDQNCGSEGNGSVIQHQNRNS